MSGRAQPARARVSPINITEGSARTPRPDTRLASKRAAVAALAKAVGFCARVMPPGDVLQDENAPVSTFPRESSQQMSFPHLGDLIKALSTDGADASHTEILTAYLNSTTTCYVDAARRLAELLASQQSIPNIPKIPSRRFLQAVPALVAEIDQKETEKDIQWLLPRYNLAELVASCPNINSLGAYDVCMHVSAPEDDNI